MTSFANKQGSNPLSQRFSRTSKYRQLYKEQFATASNKGKSTEYVPDSQDTIPIAEAPPKILSFYLPQFHPIPENDEWWGKGFTEWTNTTKAVPQFEEHYQPRHPSDLGFYDLRLPEVMAEQISMAKRYGIHGFCFHYYWFHGKRLLEQPIEQFLQNKSDAFDFPFCLCWANENWTRRWDGQESEVLMAQEHSIEDHTALFEDLDRYFQDPRYIKVDGKPLIFIYRPAIIEKLGELLEIWRRKAKEAGYPDIYIAATNAFAFYEKYAKEMGFDALVEFPPHTLWNNEDIPPINNSLKFLNRNYAGEVYSYNDAADFCVKRLSKKLKAMSKKMPYFPCVMTGWDNEARKPGASRLFHNATPATYETWLSEALQFSQSYNEPSEQFVFVNAWNEWAEGTYLEPDKRFGYAFLSATRKALQSAIASDTKPTNAVPTSIRLTKESNTLPNCIIIGANGAISADLYHLIGKHPDVYTSRIQEPLFFGSFSEHEAYYRQHCMNAQNHDELLEHMLKDYSGQSVIVEASSAYSAVHTIHNPFAEMMYSTTPDAKFLYILRNPLERMVAKFRAVSRFKNTSLMFNQALQDESYLHVSLYYAQLARFLRYFQPEQFHIVLLEEFVKDPTSHLQGIYSFFGLQSEHVDAPDMAANLADSTSSSLQFSDKNYERIMEHIAYDVSMMEQFLGKSLSLWDVSRERWCKNKKPLVQV